MTSTLENEDLDNGPLVRMEDVQPARARSCEIFKQDAMKNEPIDAYIVDQLDYDNECVVDDDDSNIGSMVSIQSEDVTDADTSGELDLIGPDVKPADTKPIKIELIPGLEVKTPPDSWPTLEILPGGVIKNNDKAEEDLSSIYPNVDHETEEDGRSMMYACAKCSQSFKYLFNLVRHVRSHEKEKKVEKLQDTKKLISLERQLVQLKRAQLDLKIKHKRQKVELLTRIAKAASSIEDINIFL